MKKVVVIPVYRIGKVIQDLVKEINEVSSPNNIVIVADKSDNPNDNTFDIVDDLESKVKNVIAIKRKKKTCLKDAYVDGFKKSLELQADAILEMDGDFGHNPSYLPTFFEEIEGNDVVWGSRFMSRDNTLPLKRYLLSYGGTQLVNLVHGTNFTDMTNGFICYSRPALESINLDQLKSQGHFYQTEMKVKLARAGMKIKEVPTDFTDSPSNVNLKDALESLRLLVKI